MVTEGCRSEALFAATLVYLATIAAIMVSGVRVLLYLPVSFDELPSSIFIFN